MEIEPTLLLTLKSKWFARYIPRDKFSDGALSTIALAFIIKKSKSAHFIFH